MLPGDGATAYVRVPLLLMIPLPALVFNQIAFPLQLLASQCGEAALRATTMGQYDLMVLDLRLPKVSGVEVLRTLRDRGNGLPVLVLTAQDAVDSKVQALRMGADDYVTKNMSLPHLLARVSALFRRADVAHAPVEPAPRVGGDGCRDIARNPADIRMVVAMGLARERRSAGDVRDSDGNFLWAQITDGLLGVLGFGRGSLLFLDCQAGPRLGDL